MDTDTPKGGKSNRPCAQLLEKTDDAHRHSARFSWMIFSYFFNIDGKASSQHIDDRIPHLLSLGVDPNVISSICPERSADVAHYRAPSIAPSGIRFELRYLKRRSKIIRIAAFPLLIAVLPFYLIEKIFIDLESEWSWFPAALIRGLLLSKRSRPEVIYSTGGPASAHLAAGLLSLWTKIPWIAELQDPIVFNNWKRSKTALKIHCWLEGFIIKKASAVIFLAEGAKEKSLRRNAGDANAFVVYPGACPSYKPPAVRRTDGVCRFAHFGSLAGTRNPEKVLEGIQMLLDLQPHLIEKMRLDFYGSMDEISSKIIDRFKYSQIVSKLGKAPRAQALHEMAQSDVLILIQNLDDISYETIPSKVYEYLQAGKPILGLVHQNRQLARMLLDQGHVVAAADSAADISEQIKRLFERWLRKDRDLPNYPDSPYTIKEAAQKLLAISRSI